MVAFQAVFHKEAKLGKARVLKAKFSVRQCPTHLYLIHLFHSPRPRGCTVVQFRYERVGEQTRRMASDITSAARGPHDGVVTDTASAVFRVL